MIHQELNPILDMQVYENVYVGRELHRGILVDRPAMLRETEKLLAELGIDIPATAFMRDLSVAQCQLIEIVKAISISAKVVVMDEPTSAITDKEVETLFRQIRRLQSEGLRSSIFRIKWTRFSRSAIPLRCCGTASLSARILPRRWITTSSFA